MIKSLKVTGLNQRMSFNLSFHEDINVITGKNGSGKTTVLKLLWYAISGNLERIISEIPFKSFALQTDNISLGMDIQAKAKHSIVKVTYQIGTSEPRSFERPQNGAAIWEELEQLNRHLSRATGSSVFLPTFRRIEGGFSISARQDDSGVRFMRAGKTATWSSAYVVADSSGIQQAMNQLSERLSVGDHRFVASISTDDINRLLTLKYAEISERNNRLHMELSRSILDQVGARTGGELARRQQREGAHNPGTD